MLVITMRLRLQSNKVANFRIFNRREFAANTTRAAAALLLAPSHLLRAAGPQSTPTRPDVAVIDRTRILTAADHYLTQKPTPITAIPSPRSPKNPHDYYSEPQSFTAHRDALFTLGLAVPALADAHLLTGEPRYADHAALYLRAWFIDPATRMTPSLEYGAVSTPKQAAQAEGILETLPLVEIAQAIPFLASSLTAADRAALNAWFAAYLDWLTAPLDSGPRLAALARDRKDHHATSWLLQVAAYTLLTTPDGTAPKAESKRAEDLRHLFRTKTLRAQIAADGSFPHELTSATPYRDSLFNLDMLAAMCLLLSTRFDNVWNYELEDGPGMRSAIAYHFPFIADRTHWPFRADSANFNQLPARRASLLFCARAYSRPEYAVLWSQLPPDPPSPEILRTLPIHQPLLWVTPPPRVE